MNASCEVGSDGKTCRRGTCLKRRYDLVKILLQQQRSPFCFPLLQFLLPDKKSHFRYFFVLLKLYQNVMECGCLGFMCKNVSWKCEKGLKIVDPMKTTSSSTYSNTYLVMHFFSTEVCRKVWPAIRCELMSDSVLLIQYDYWKFFRNRNSKKVFPILFPFI